MSKALATGRTLDELARLFHVSGRPSIRRAQAFYHWLYRGEGRHLPAEVPAEMPDLSHRVLRPLRGELPMPRLALRHQEVSSDGTIKLLLDAGEAPLETVMIPTLRRVTVCVSSQSGCARDCGFCATAKMGLRRSLSAGEIVAQVMMAAQVAPAGVPVRNVVFMGMGEPMDNLDEVLRAIDVLTETSGLGLAARHITVSTCGVLPKMERFVEESKALLAISLNGTTEAQRQAIMPVERRHPLPELLRFIHTRATDERPFLLEYILLGGFNDSDADAQRLIEMFAGASVRINLIPFNPHVGAPYGRPTGERVFEFHRRLMDSGIRVYVRTTRGDEIAAACGQLQRGLKEERRRKAEGQAAPMG